MSHLALDLRHALRSLLRAPLAPLAAALSLGIALAAATAALAFLQAYALRPLPFDAPERLQHVWMDMREAERASVPDVLDWRERTRAFEELAAFNYTSETLTDGAYPERVDAARVSANAFRVLGLQPLLGRDFANGEDARGEHRVVLLRERFWRERYGADPNVLGRTLHIEGEAFTVVGVMPDRAIFPLPTTQLWIPRVLTGQAYERDARFLQVFGRLRPGVTPAQARADMDRVAAELAALYPESNRDARVRLEPLGNALNFAEQIIVPLSGILMGAALLLFLLACANVGNLFIARGAARDREYSVRAALGAGRWRILRARLMEAGLVAAAAAALGVALGHAGAAALAGILPPDLYHVGSVRPDALTLAGATLLAAGAALFLSLAPALRTDRAPLMERLRRREAGAGGGRARARLQNLLVAAEAAGAVILLVATALLGRSLEALRSADPGFDGAGVLAVDVQLPPARYDTDERVLAFQRRLVDEAAALPGAQAATLVDFLPLNHEWPRVEVAGSPATAAGEGAGALRLRIGPDYLRTLRIPLVRGRGLEPSDAGHDERVALVDERLAERLWPGEDPLGRELLMGRERTPARVVGVTRATRQDRLDDAAAPVLYVAAGQAPTRYFRLLVRAGNGDAAALAPQARALVADLDPLLALGEVRPLSEVVEAYALPQLRGAQMLSVLGVVALVLATLGIFGVVAYGVSQRVREIAVRQSLGATPAAIRRLLLGRTLRMAAGGVAAGLVVAGVLSRFAASLLFGVAELDPVSFGVPTLLLLGVAGGASLLATRRATAIQPVDALRAEG